MLRIEVLQPTTLIVFFLLQNRSLQPVTLATCAPLPPLAPHHQQLFVEFLVCWAAVEIGKVHTLHLVSHGSVQSCTHTSSSFFVKCLVGLAAVETGGVHPDRPQHVIAAALSNYN